MKKKTFKKYLFLLTIIISMIFSNLSVYAASPKASLKISKSTLVMSKGKSTKLKVTKNGIRGTVKWKSSNKKIATVSKSGTVTSKGYGSCTITASVGKYSAKCKITVKKPTINPAIGTYNGQNKVIIIHRVTASSVTFTIGYTAMREARVEKMTVKRNGNRASFSFRDDRGGHGSGVLYFKDSKTIELKINLGSVSLIGTNGKYVPLKWITKVQKFWYY